MVEHPSKPKRRWLRLLLAVAVCAALAFAGLVFYVFVLQGPQVPRGPVRMVRGADGRLVPAQPPEPEGGLGLQALAANTRCSDALSATASTITGSVARFACRRVLILNRSSHLLMQRMGPRLLAQLRGLEGAGEINYAPDGRVQDAGGMAPDVVIVLDMPSVHESGSLGETRLSATVVCSAGSSLAAGRTGYTDSLTPPCLRFQWTATLDHQSVTKGIASRSAQYVPQADDIARQLGAALVKLLNGYLEKYGPVPELPAAFYPPYRPADAPPVPEGCALEPLASWHGLMAANDSYWRLTGPATLPAVQRALAAGGWHIDSAAGDGPHGELRATRGEGTLRVFPEDAKADGGPFCVHFLHRISRADLAAAVDSTFADGTPADTLLLFSGSWSREQRDRALDLLRDRPLTAADACLSLAELCQGAGRQAQARAAIARASVLMLVTPDAGELDSRARSIARGLNVEAFIDAPPSAGGMAGFTRLPGDGQTIERETALGEPALFFIKEGKKIGAVSVRVAQGADGVCQVAHVEFDGAGKSWGSGGAVTAQQPAHLTLLNGRIDVTVRRQPAPGRFIVAARLLTPNTHHDDTTNAT